MIPRHTFLLCRLVTVVVLALCAVGSSTEAVQHTRAGATVESSRYGRRSTNRTSKQTTTLELTNVEAPLTSIPESSVTSAAPVVVLSTLTSLHLTSDHGTSPSLTTTVVPTNAVTRALSNTSDDQPTSVSRGDLPPNSDSEETVEDVSGLLFSPLETLFTPSEERSENEPTTSDDSVIDQNPTGYIEMDFHSPEGSVSVNDIQRELTSVMELSNVTLESSQTTVSSFDLLSETPGNKPTNIEDISIDHSPSEDFEVDPLSLTSPSSVSANPSGLVTLKEFSAVTVELDQTTVPNFNEQEIPEYEPAALESSSISQSSTVDLHLHASSESVRVNPNELVSAKEFSHVSDVLSQSTVSSLDFLHKTSENERNTIENSFIDQNPEVNHEVELHSQLILSSVRNNSSELSALKELNNFTSAFNDTTVSSFNVMPKTPANESISIESSFVTQSPARGPEDDFHTLARTVSIKENTSVLASVKALIVTDALEITVELKETTVSSFSRLHEEDHTENVADTSKFASIDVHSDGLTPHTSSFQELYDNRIWFFIVLRGNCHLVKLDNTNILASDFITSFSLLLLYSKDKIVVHSLECSGVKMKVNMTVDSAYYPNCEEDLNTLLSHKNLRVDLHNTSFYIESYETKRTLIFETKSDIEKDNFNILYLILGGVAVSIIFIIFAAIIFVIYRHLVLNRTKFNLGTLDTILSESPRSLHYKMEVDHTVRFSDTDTYYVKMYKSCSDLSSLDRYDQYGFIDHPTATIQSSSQASTNKKKSNKSIKQSHRGSYKLENRHRDLWLGRPTHAGEEIMSIRNVNNMNPYDCNTEEQEESLNTVLRNGSPNSRLETTAAHTDDNIDSSACPSSVAPQNDVMKRMDDLISTTFSNSSPNITADPVGDTTYRTAYSNVIASLPAGNLNTITTTTGDSKFSPASYSSNTPSYNTAASNVPPTTKTSAENLCLTRITFLEMRVWPRRTAAQHNIPGLKVSGKPKPSQMINQDDILEVKNV